MGLLDKVISIFFDKDVYEDDEFTVRGFEGVWLDETLGTENRLYLDPKIRQKLLDWRVLYIINIKLCDQVFTKDLKDKSIILLPLCVIFELFLKQLFKDIKLSKSIKQSLGTSLDNTNLVNFSNNILRNFNKKDRSRIISKLKELKSNTLQDIRHSYLHGDGREIDGILDLENKIHSVISTIKETIIFFRDFKLIKNKNITRKEIINYLYRLDLSLNKKNKIQKIIGKIAKRECMNWSDILGKKNDKNFVNARREVAYKLKEKSISIKIIAEVMGNRSEGTIYRLIRAYENKK